mmetsp:Transcript_10344/g.14280  ORF Transcript_10344/g.14280 Transcript_10344/m.14280 type:complete len:1121 (+) Transcript_10344:54-3416(+)
MKLLIFLLLVICNTIVNQGVIEPVTKLTASDTSSWFGSSVAASSDVVAVSTTSFTGVNNGVYIYTKQESSWIVDDLLFSSDENTLFGFSPYNNALSFIDNLLLIVTAYNDNGATDSSGAIYVFKNEDGKYKEIQKLLSGDQEATGIFPTHVATARTSSDSVIIYGGAPLNDNTSGQVYVYRSDNFEEFSRSTILKASDAADNDLFGLGIAAYGDAVLIAAPGQDDFVGAVYAFKTNDNGFSYVQTAKLQPLQVAYYSALAMTATYAVICAPSQTYDSDGACFAYFTSDSGESWKYSNQLLLSDALYQGTEFGDRVSIEENNILISGTSISTEDSVVYYFNTPDDGKSFTHLGTLISNRTNNQDADNFGAALALSGEIAFVSAPYHDTDLIDSGTVFIYDLASRPKNQPTLAPVTSRPYPVPTIDDDEFYAPSSDYYYFDFPSYYIPSYEYPTPDNSNTGREDKQAKNSGIVLGKITSILVGSQVAVAALNGITTTTTCGSSSTTTGLKSSALFLISMAFAGRTEIIKRSETAAASFFRKWGKQYNWLLFEWGPITRGNRDDENENNDYREKYQYYDDETDKYERRRLVDSSPHRCRSPRLADAVITVILVIIAVIIAHVCIFSLVGALAQAAQGTADAEKARREMDASLLWPRTLWPFAMFFVLALVLGASPTMALDACWTNRGPAWGGLFVSLFSIILYGGALCVKVGPRIYKNAKFRSHYRGQAEPITGYLAPPRDLFSAICRAITHGEPLYQRFGFGEWIESISTQRFVASHGAAFEDFLPKFARVGEAIEAVPDIMAALVLGIARRAPKIQIWTLFCIALISSFPLLMRPYVNSVFNSLELVAKLGNTIVLLFLGIAATNTNHDQALIATALIIDVLVMLIVVGVQVICAVAVLIHALWKLRKRKNDDQLTSTKDPALQDEDIDAGAAAGGAVINVSKEGPNQIVDTDDLGQVRSDDYAIDAAATSTAAFGRSALTLFGAMSTAYRAPDATAVNFFSTFCRLAAAEIIFITLWLFGLHDTMTPSTIHRVNLEVDDNTKQSIATSSLPQNNSSTEASSIDQEAVLEMVDRDEKGEDAAHEIPPTTHTTMPPPPPTATVVQEEESGPLLEQPPSVEIK